MPIRQGGKKARAAAIIQDELANGPKLSTEVHEACRLEGALLN